MTGDARDRESSDAPNGVPEAALPPAEETRPDDVCSRKVYDELYDRWVRLRAEFDNYRKRSEREKADWRVLANERMLTELIPVLDHLELALRHAGEEPAAASLAEGVRLVLRQFEGVMENFGLVAVQALGKPFDPRIHEAVAQEESLEADEGAVLRELQRGWLLGGKLLRPSRVVVSRRPGAERETLPG